MTHLGCGGIKKNSGIKKFGINQRIVAKVENRVSRHLDRVYDS